MGSSNVTETRLGVMVVDESALGAFVSTITFSEVRSAWVMVTD